MAVADHTVDTSALMRLQRPTVQYVLEPLVEQGRAALCSTVLVELLWSTRNVADYDELVRDWGHNEVLDVEPVDWLEAISVQRELWRRGLHRAVGWPDLLLACVAARHEVLLLHYDKDFDLIADVTGQATRWVVPAGSVP